MWELIQLLRGINPTQIHYNITIFMIDAAL